jgi:ankyrin repeat protein
VNIIDSFGWTPLVRAIKACDHSHIRLLIHHGAAINTSTHPECCPLILACSGRQTATVSLLLDHGANYGHLGLKYYTEEIQQLVRNARACDDRARVACGAIWTALYRHQRLPRELVQMLMRSVWQEKRNKVWLEA